jgi:hypothetical protein
MKWTRVGIAALIVLSSLTPTWADEALPRLFGSWVIKYDNGVQGYYTLRATKTASIWEPGRDTAGKIEVRDGDVVVVNDDGRMQRWTPVGRRAVVEHWEKAADYPGKATVVGIAEVFQVHTEKYEPAFSLLEPEPPDMQTVKGLVDAMRKPLSDETAGELRQYIDPAWLKENELEEGAFPVRRVVTRKILGRARVDSHDLPVRGNRRGGAGGLASAHDRGRLEIVHPSAASSGSLHESL